MGSLWQTAFQYIFARGYIRIPFYLGLTLLYMKYGLDIWEDKFKLWNKGHNQNDIWDRLSKKVLLLNSEQELEGEDFEEEEFEDGEEED